MKNIVALAATACICGSLAAKDRIVVVPAHPDDLIPCFKSLGTDPASPARLNT